MLQSFFFVTSKKVWAFAFGFANTTTGNFFGAKKTSKFGFGFLEWQKAGKLFRKRKEKKDKHTQKKREEKPTAKKIYHNFALWQKTKLKKERENKRDKEQKDNKKKTLSFC